MSKNASVINAFWALIYDYIACPAVSVAKLLDRIVWQFYRLADAIVTICVRFKEYANYKAWGS
jgi:hypothetical protein